MRFFLLLLATTLFPGACVLAQTAEWVWHANTAGAKPVEGEVRHFRRPFTVVGKVLKAQLNASCDDQLSVWLNGKPVGESSSWKEPLKADVTAALKSGENLLAVRGRNEAGTAALVVVLDIEQEYGKRQVIMTDRTWQSASEVQPGWETGGEGTGWSNVALVAKLGAPPWGNIFNAQPAGATPAAEITVPAGFKVELLRSAQPGEGSWVALAIDPKGRLYLSPQAMGKEAGGPGGMLRVTLDPAGAVGTVEPVPVPVGAAMGLLWAFDSLYAAADGPDGRALYRLQDSDRDDQLESVRLLKKFPGGNGEHGLHGMSVGPDNRLYIAAGNSTPLVEGTASTSPYRHWGEDNVISRVLDPVATFFDKLKAPYGYVLRTDPEGREWDLVAGGFRNHYDIDFSPDGELFTYDSDMEWDLGLPWYRPTRILQITSGAEFGFREGSSKWPEHYPDSLPGVADIGLGSPTGVKFGTRSSFPEQYRRAFFAMDWTFGRILAVHLKSHGAGYEATFEDFLRGKGMPVTDLEFGPDGAMYFIVGGRGTQAGLYRVSYVGASDKALPATASAVPDRENPQAASARALRRELESFHGRVASDAVEKAWPHLNSDDRFLRFAARVAIESQPLDAWRQRAMGEKEPRAGLQAMLALTRCGSRADQEDVLARIGEWKLASLDEPLQLDKLRVIGLSIARHGKPGETLLKMAAEKLGARYPAPTFALNRELSQLLVAVGAPEATAKTVALLEKSEKPEEQVWYAYVLREAQGWTPELRARYFAWFDKARILRGGNSFAKFITRIRDQALANVPEGERGALLTLLEQASAPKTAAPLAPARQFVQAWTMADLAPALEQVGRGRDFARGRQVFAGAQCLQCHHFGSEGGNNGPDLTAVASRFSRRDLLESIIDPSKGISEQYAQFLVTLKDGETVVGQIAEDNNDHLVLVTDPLAGTRRVLAKGNVQSREMSPVSLMPPGLLNVFSKEEILDLLAYMESGGNQAGPQFQARK